MTAQLKVLKESKCPVLQVIVEILMHILQRFLKRLLNTLNFHRNRLNLSARIDYASYVVAVK